MDENQEKKAPEIGAPVKVIEAAKEAKDVVSRGAKVAREAVHVAKEKIDQKALRPVFRDDLLRPMSSDNNDSRTTTLQMALRPYLICVVERDKKRQNKEICKGAVGYWTMVKGVQLLNIYEDEARNVGIWFAPTITQTFYYIDPYKRNVYVDLNHYFQYLKKERVNELELIAQDLGARCVRITYKEHEKKLVRKKVKVDVKAGRAAAEGAADSMDTEVTRAEIAADIQFYGHDKPKVPELLYFRNESDIEKLIRMRMDTTNPIKSKDYHFWCSSTCGITEKVAAKLDGVLRHMKIKGNGTVSSEVQRESRTELVYHIEF